LSQSMYIVFLNFFPLGYIKFKTLNWFFIDWATISVSVISSRYDTGPSISLLILSVISIYGDLTIMTLENEELIFNMTIITFLPASLSPYLSIFPYVSYVWLHCVFIALRWLCDFCTLLCSVISIASCLNTAFLLRYRRQRKDGQIVIILSLSKI